MMLVVHINKKFTLLKVIFIYKFYINDKNKIKLRVQEEADSLMK